MVEYCVGRQGPKQDVVLQKEIKKNKKSCLDWSGTEPGSLWQVGTTNRLNNGTASSKTSTLLSVVKLETALSTTATFQSSFYVPISFANYVHGIGWKQNWGGGG
jgi:hypothetical protein